MDDRLARLENELRAIEWWDERYRQERTHDKLFEDAYSARQERRQEIEREIQAGGFPSRVNRVSRDARFGGLS